MSCACLQSIFELRGFIILSKPWGTLRLIKGLLLERAARSGRWLTISGTDLIGSARRLIKSAKLLRKVKLFLSIRAILCHMALLIARETSSLTLKADFIGFEVSASDHGEHWSVYIHGNCLIVRMTSLISIAIRSGRLMRFCPMKFHSFRISHCSFACILLLLCSSCSDPILHGIGLIIAVQDGVH